MRAAKFSSRDSAGRFRLAAAPMPIRSRIPAMQGGGRARMSDLGPGRRAQEMVRRPEEQCRTAALSRRASGRLRAFLGNWLTPLPALGDNSILGAFAENFLLRYLAFEPDAGPLYSSAQFDFDKDLPRMASAAKLFSATTFNPAAPADLPSTDLSAFDKHGGKLSSIMAGPTCW